MRVLLRDESFEEAMKYIVEVDERGTVWRNEKGELHREDGPARERADGTKEWWINGKCHRLDGPASEYANGDKYWYVNGKLHREDGPAIERADGTKSWYLNDEKLSEEEFNSRRAKVNTSLDGKEVEIDGCKYVLRKL